MSKTSTFLLKLVTLLLILTISLSSCEVIGPILNGNTNEDPDVENNGTDSGEKPNHPDDSNSDEQTPPHSHSYISTVTPPTCTSEGYTTYSCECGKSFTADKTTITDHTYVNGICSVCGADEPIPPHRHDYSAKTTAPTCTEDGYTVYTCECGDSYTADHVGKLDHSFSSGHCTVCGEKDPDYTPSTGGEFNYSEVPEYTDKNYVAINGNVPYFTEDEITSDYFESYSDLDKLGRVGVAFASLGRETLPTSNRGSLSYNPTGWVQKNYPANIVSTTQIYNRSHLIAWSLSGEDNNSKNLMTGTPYFNQIGMQVFENMVLDYIKETGNHVMYRVTPVFVGDNLLAHGVLMEGWSVEDKGDGICFCVFMYNVQPGVILEYETGNNYLPESGGDDMSNTATLVTDISEIKAGDKIIIVAKNANYAMGDISSSGNNRVAIEIKKEGNTITFSDDVAVITLGNGTSVDTFSFEVGGSYLCVTSSSKNYLKTQTTLADNGSWTISISGGSATVKAKGSYTRNWLRYNPSNIIFSAYGSGQQDICIYKVNE